MTDQPLEDEPAASQKAEPEEPPPTEPEAEPEPGLEPEPEPTRVLEPEPTTWPEPERRLWRSRKDRVIAGVCGGLGEYLKVDPVLVRIAAIVLVFAGGAGIVLYLVGWIAIPEEPEPAAGEPAGGEPAAAAPTTERTSGAVVLGFVFVLLGLLFLADELWPDFLSWQYIWPIGLIAIGLAILLRGKR